MASEFTAQNKAIRFQELYYPIDVQLDQQEQKEAIRFSFAQGWEMAMRNKIESLHREIEKKDTRIAELEGIVKKYEWLEHESYDLRSEEIRTFDDADIRWMVYSHHMDKPTLRLVGIGGSTPLEAIESAMRGDAVVDAPCKRCGHMDLAWKQDAGNHVCQECC